uniref:Uncharacterized protein LOC114348786 n=1 Tax=Diabrotica virgifera virgifera TaxID=50390 RepID=A0A6P7HHF1_DIAVI
MEKLRFDFKMVGAQDGKTNMMCITSIGTPDGKTFLLPDEFQPANLHKEVCKTQVYARIKNSIKKRNKSRKVWITLTEELSKIYLDEDENLYFENQYLEELTESDSEPTSDVQVDTIQKLLEKLMENKEQTSEIQNLSKIAKDFMIEKFDGKNINANQWLSEFERECERCLILEEKKKIEILKFFLEKASIDWYSCMILKFTVESDWEDWKNNFCETFGSKGWSQIRYAHTFKYQTGSLLEYAIKKEKLLLQVSKSIDTSTLIDLIAIGLPNNVADKIDREILQGTQDLYNEIGKLEHLATRSLMKKKKYTENKFKQLEEKTP